MRALLPVLFALGAGSFACSEGSSWVTPPHRAFPEVATRDGALLSPMGLVTVVSESDEPVLRDTFFRFSKQIGESGWWHRVAPEYGLTTLESLAELTGPAIDHDMTDHDVFEYITAAVAANGGPAKDGNTLYLLYLPPGVTIISEGVANTDCKTLGGYHDRYGSRGDNLAIIQRCSPDPNDAIVSATHEVIEAATDPDLQGYASPGVGPKPWRADVWNAYDLTGHAEVGDLCFGTFYEEGRWYYQRVWSNTAAAAGGDPCIPEIGESFYDTTFDKDWYPVQAGESVTIPVTGWATGPVPDWGLELTVQPDAGYAAVPGVRTLGSGQRANIVVTAPPDVQSGSYAVVNVMSTRPERSYFTDGLHLNLVGVYVP